MLINGGLDNTLQEGLLWERSNSPGRGPDMEERLANFGKNKQRDLPSPIFTYSF